MRPTAVLIVVTTLSLIAYDLTVWLCLGPGATISEVLLGAASICPAVPFAFGFLMGHLFWPQVEEGKK